MLEASPPVSRRGFSTIRYLTNRISSVKLRFVPTNVLGGELKNAAVAIGHGLYRDGFFVASGPGDVGLHTVCV